MALPTLDATFASSVDLPRKQMLAKWLVEELGSGSVADYWTLPERHLWAKIAVAAGAPRGEADYISLPKNYAWSDIYNAVAGSNGNHTDWSENVALGHIAAAYRGDTANPEALATYIDWPWRYQVASIIGGITPSGPQFPLDGLLAFWKLDDLTDASGNGNTLTNNNTVTFGSGKIGNSAIFDRSNYLSINGMNLPSGNDDRSISLWAKTSELSQLNFALSYGGTDVEGTNAAYGIGILNGELKLFTYDDDLGTSQNIADEQWHFIVATHSSSNGRRIYLDNVLVGNDSATLVTTSNTTLRIGTWTYAFGDTGWVGNVDAVGVWNKTLTTDEINILYNSGNGIEM